MIESPSWESHSKEHDGFTTSKSPCWSLFCSCVDSPFVKAEWADYTHWNLDHLSYWGSAEMRDCRILGKASRAGTCQCPVEVCTVHSQLVFITNGRAQTSFLEEIFCDCPYGVFLKYLPNIRSPTYPHTRLQESLFTSLCVIVLRSCLTVDIVLSVLHPDPVTWE